MSNTNNTTNNTTTANTTNNATTANKEPSKTMIYVSNLPFSTTDEELKKLFEGIAVKTAYVAKRRNGRSKGFGFVNVEKEEEQQKAIEKINGQTVSGRVVTAKVAFNDPRRNERGELKEEFKKLLENPEPSKTAIYVSNLPFSLNDEGLKGVFNDFEVKSATVATRNNGRSMGFGFVEFNTVEQQQKALSYDKKEVDGRPLSIKIAKNYLGPNRPRRQRRRNLNFRPRRQRPFFQTQRPRASGFSLYVANLPFDLDNNDLREIFTEFNVKEAHIAMYRSGRSKGFGFVEFFNAKSQQEALEALDQSEVNSRVITVRVARGRQQRRPPFVRRRRQPQQQQQQTSNKPREPSQTLVYVSNLPFALNDQQLTELFKGYDVVKAYVATRKSGKSKGFGFVDFASNKEQQRAIKENANLESMGRKLTLQIANKVVAKEETNQQSAETNEQSNQQAEQSNQQATQDK